MVSIGWPACCVNRVFGRLAGYEDVNDAERLRRDPAMRWVVGDRAITSSAASASQTRLSALPPIRTRQRKSWRPSAHLNLS
jgi:hypothetical protein